MKISVVTVCFNSAATLGAALASVREQTHPQVEHLVIDGASRDGTLGVVEREGSHVARLVSEPDAGIYDAMNKGLRLASGDLVGFLNADDVLADPQALARVAQAAAGPEAAPVDAVYGDLLYVRHDDLGQVVRRWHAGAFHPGSLRRGWMPPHPTFYVRRELALALGGFDAALRIAGDYEFMLRVLTRPQARLAYVPQVQVRMRLGGASNASLGGLRRKSAEDLLAVRRHGLGGWPVVACKILRKLPQFLPAPDATSPK
jgi:glycosyltransferase